MSILRVQPLYHGHVVDGFYGHQTCHQQLGMCMILCNHFISENT
jgi:hypothetical protein